MWKSDGVYVCNYGGDKRELLSDDFWTLIIAMRTTYGAAATVMKAFSS